VKRTSPDDFTPTSPFISPPEWRELEGTKRDEVRNGSKKDAAETPDEAGATPPFDARCVTVAAGSLPPQSRAAPDPFSRDPGAGVSEL
jgi:hypothetical protein